MKTLLLLVLVGAASAWQNCDRSYAGSTNTNGQWYTRAWPIDLRAREPVFVFSYEGCKNAKLRFTETTDSNSRGFNINIDVRSSGKPETYINYRDGSGKWTRMFNLNVGRKCECRVYKDFWVSWDYATRKIAIGAGKNPNLGEWGSQIIPESQLTNVRYVHVSSGPQNRATWKLYKQCPSIEPVNSCGSADTACNTCKGAVAKAFNSPKTANSVFTTLWDVVDLQEKEPIVVVGIKSCEGIRMRFLEEKNIDGEGYNANIDINIPSSGDGPNDNWSRLNYRTGKTGKSATKFIISKELLTPQKLSCGTFNYFWVKWDYDTGELSMGEGRDPSQGEYLYSMMTDFRKLNVRYMAVQSNAAASWKIYEQCPLPTVAPECEEESDCEENFYCKDEKCVECPEGTKRDNGECKAACVDDTECPSGSACDAGTNVCNKCPAGTAPRMGFCDEICSASDKCTDPKHACIDGFCDPCGPYEIVDGDACVSICELKKNEDCSKKSKRYFYKATAGICVEFQGCEGELSNSFPSKTDCIDICTPKKIPPECLLDTDAGTCEDYSRRYYYNKEVMACKKFEYNGCDGNANNFLSKDACRLHCAKYD